MTMISSLRENPWREAGVGAYAVCCFVALGAMLLLLEHRGLEQYSLIPVLVGIVGVVTRWTSSPQMVLVALSGCLFVEHNTRLRFSRPSTALRLDDIWLCMVALAFVASHFRLQSVADRIFPADPTRRTVAPDERASCDVRRSPRLVTPAEIGTFLLILPVWAVAAQIGLGFLLTNQGNPGIKEPLWRSVVVAWAIGTLILFAATILGSWRIRTMSSQEAELYLQDVLWRETRGEQRRINRFLAWDRLRLRTDVAPFNYRLWAWTVTAALGMFVLYLYWWAETASRKP